MSKDTHLRQPRQGGRFVKDEKIDFDTAVKLLEFAVRGREDYVYDDRDGLNGQRCRNWNVLEDRPSCLVGTILYDWGVPKEDLINNSHSGVWAFERFIEGDGTLKFLETVQGLQDEGYSWGEAVKKALEIHRS